MLTNDDDLPTSTPTLQFNSNRFNSTATMKGICPEHGWFLSDNTGGLTSNDVGLGSTVQNSGFTTSLSQGDVVQLWKTVAITAHEIG